MHLPDAFRHSEAEPHDGGDVLQLKKLHARAIKTIFLQMPVTLRIVSCLIFHMLAPCSSRM